MHYLSKKLHSMGKVLNSNNPKDKVGVRVPDKKSDGFIVLDNGDYEFYIGNKLAFSLSNIKTNSDLVAQLSTEIDNGDYEPASRGLENLKQSFYRNLEADNTLPPEEYVGRIRPLETPIYCIYKSGTELILANVPTIKEFISNPNIWQVFSITSGQVADNSKRIMSVQKIGNYTVGETTYNYCYRVITNTALSCNVLDKIVIWSFLANGVVMNYGCAVPSSTNNWNDGTAVPWVSVPSFGASWVHSDGSYRGIASTTYSTNPLGDRIKLKLMSTSDRLNGTNGNGNWTLVTNGSGATTALNKITIPVEYDGIGQLIGIQKVPGSDLYCSPIALYKEWIAGMPGSSAGYGYYGMAEKLGIVVYDEDLDYQKLILPDIDYVFENFISGNAYGISLCNYKGKYYYSIHDGGSVLGNEGAYGAAGKRVVLVSDTIEGPYILDSTIFDLADASINYPGSMYTFSAANGSFIKHNSELYYIVACSPNEFSSGLYRNFQFSMFKYSDANKTWTNINTALLQSFHAYQNFPEIVPDKPAWGNWGWDHLGVVTPHYFEGNKLWMGMTMTGGFYASTIGYIDLTKALK